MLRAVIELVPSLHSTYVCRSDFERSGDIKILNAEPINGCNYKNNAEARTALHIAAERKDLAKVRVLLETQPADANLTDKVCF